MQRHWIYSILEESVNIDNVSGEVWKSLSRISEIVSQSADYCFRTKRAEDLFDKIQDAGKVQDLSHLIYDVAINYGFQHGSIFLRHAGISGGIWSHRVCTSLSERWLRHYEKMEYQFIDPAIFHSPVSMQPVFVTRTLNDSPRVAHFWDEAGRYGVGATVYCGNHKTKSGSLIGFSLLTQDSEKVCSKRIKHDASDIFRLTESLASIFEELASTGYGASGKLSQEELLFLKAVLLGKSVSEPINIRGFRVCPKSVQATISRKLGVDTILQAIAVAAARGWFDDTLYSSGEVHTIFENLPDIEDLKLKKKRMAQVPCRSFDDVGKKDSHLDS